MSGTNGRRKRLKIVSGEQDRPWRGRKPEATKGMNVGKLPKPVARNGRNSPSIEAGMKDMADKKLLKTGLISSAVMAVCCFTPVLVLTMGAVGLSGLVGWWLDLLLLPALALFVLMAGYGFYRLRRRRAQDA
jgi:mercuric ion transport protein